MQLLSWIHRLPGLSLSRKMVILCTAVLLVQLICQTFFVIRPQYSIYLTQYSKAVNESLASAEAAIEKTFDDVRSWQNVISDNLGYMNLLYQRASDERNIRKRLDSTVQTIFTSHSEIQMLTFWTAYDMQRTRIMRRFPSYSYNWSTQEALEKHYSFSARDLISSGFLIGRCGYSKGTDSQSLCIPVVWGLNDSEERLLAAMIADLDFDLLDNQFARFAFEDGELLVLLNQNGELLYCYGQNEALTRHFLMGEHLPGNSYENYDQYTLNGERYYAFHYPNPQTGLQLLRLIPSRLVESEMKRNQLTSMIITLGSFLITLLLMIYGVKGFAKSFLKLSDAMRSVGRGNFSATVPPDEAEAEFRPLIETFNEMTVLIQRLFREKYQLTIEQQKAELKALQAQINPHFMNNTLQMINGMALKHNAFEINVVVNALAEMMRYCITTDDGPVTLSDEEDNVKQYLLIQKMRFMSKLNFSFQIEPELKKLPIPRMILQPLVENCIVHSMDRYGDVCGIEVTARRNADAIVLCIRNSCCEPIPPEKLNQLKKSLISDNSEGREHIGLKNCCRRLKLFYGDTTGFELDSSREKGTSVTVTIQQDAISRLKERNRL